MKNKKLYENLIKAFMISVGGVLLAFYLITGKSMSENPDSGDFFKFYTSAQRVLAGESPYWSMAQVNSNNKCSPYNIESLWSRLQNDTEPSPKSKIDCLHSNLNTPSFVMITSPLGLTDYKTAWWIWGIGSLVFGLFSMLLLNRHLISVSGSIISLLILSIAYLSYAPTLINFLFGQLANYLLLPLTLGWIWGRSGQDTRCGAILGVIASIKLFFGLFLIIFILCKRWRAATAFSVAGLSSLLISLVIMGKKPFHDYLHALHHVTWHGNSWNASIHGFFTRFLGGGETPAALNTSLQSIILILSMSTLILLILVATTRHLKNLERESQTDFMIAMGIPAMLLLSPLGWIYYFPLLIISLLILWRHSKNLAHKIHYRLLLVLAVSMTTLPRSMHFPNTKFSLQEVFLDTALPTYALLVVMLTGVAILFAQPRSSFDRNRESQ